MIRTRSTFEPHGLDSQLLINYFQVFLTTFFISFYHFLNQIIYNIQFLVNLRITLILLILNNYVNPSQYKISKKPIFQLYFQLKLIINRILNRKMNQNDSLVKEGPTLGSGPRNFEWYQALNKPKINPPQWVFPVVWTILYIMIIASFFVYLKDTDFTYTMALIFFSIQMILNIIWTPIFFWKKMITLALVDIVLLWIFILVTIITFHERSPIAAYLLIPYNVWVTLATYLNAYIVFNNPDPSRAPKMKQIKYEGINGHKEQFDIVVQQYIILYFIQEILFKQPMQANIQLDKIIKKAYKQSQQSLNLQQKSNQWVHVLKQRDWSLLKQINLRNCRINDNNIKNLSQRQWPGLKKLLLWKNELSAQGVKKLMENQWDALQFIDLENNAIENEGFLILSNCGMQQKRRNIKSLQLAKNNITILSIGILQTTIIKKLQHLTLSENFIGNRGMKILAKAQMNNLEDISLNSCCIGDEGITHLMKANWPRLQYFQIQNNEIGQGYVEMRNNKWDKLRYLSVGKPSSDRNQLYLVVPIWGLHLGTYENNKKIKIQKNIENKQFKEDVLKISKKYY